MEDQRVKLLNGQAGSLQTCGVEEVDLLIVWTGDAEPYTLNPKTLKP